MSDPVTIEGKIAKAAEEVRKFHKLLAAPEPGLITWWTLVAMQWDTMKKALEDFGGPIDPDSFRDNPTIE